MGGSSCGESWSRGSLSGVSFPGDFGRGILPGEYLASSESYHRTLKRIHNLKLIICHNRFLIDRLTVNNNIVYGMPISKKSIVNIHVNMGSTSLAFLQVFKGLMSHLNEGFEIEIYISFIK